MSSCQHRTKQKKVTNLHANLTQQTTKTFILTYKHTISTRKYTRNESQTKWFWCVYSYLCPCAVKDFRSFVQFIPISWETLSQIVWGFCRNSLIFPKYRNKYEWTHCKTLKTFKPVAFVGIFFRYVTNLAFVLYFHYDNVNVFGWFVFKFVFPLCFVFVGESILLVHF